MSRRRGGFSLIEMLLVLALVGVVTAKLTTVLRQASKVHRDESHGIALQDQANRVIDQIAWKVLAARRETVTPAAEAPDYAVRLRYEAHLGWQDGAPVMGFQPVGGTGFSVAQVPIPAGQHSISSDQPFGIVVYGYGQYTSYIYPGGLDFEQINPLI